MGKFKAPFSSQRSQDSGPRPKHVSTVRKQAKPSPLHLGRMDIITPKTKNKIKQRFAAGLAQLQYDMKATSPGVPVPFDLSQSQPAISQQSEPALEEDVATNEDVTVDANEDNMKPMIDSHVGHDDVTVDIPEEFYIVFDEEFNEENETCETGEDAPITTTDDEANITELSGEDVYGDTNGSFIEEISDMPNVKQRKERTKKHTNKKKTGTKARHSELLSPDHEDNIASEYDFDINEIISRPPAMSTAVRRHMRKRDYYMMVKNGVLQTIYKMHHEIQILQKRRAELVQGKADVDMHSRKTSQLSLLGGILEE